MFPSFRNLIIRKSSIEFHLVLLCNEKFRFRFPMVILFCFNGVMRHLVERTECSSIQEPRKALEFKVEDG